MVGVVLAMVRVYFSLSIVILLDDKHHNLFSR